MNDDLKEKLDDITEWWCDFADYIGTLGNATFEVILGITSVIWVIPYYYTVYKKEQEEYKKYIEQLQENINE